MRLILLKNGFNDFGYLVFIFIKIKLMVYLCVDYIYFDDLYCIYCIFVRVCFFFL